MYGAIIVFLFVSLFVMPLCAKIMRRPGVEVQAGVQTKPAVGTPQLKSVQQQEAMKNEIVAQLDRLLQHDVMNDEWYKAINDLVIDLVPIDKALSIEYFKKIQTKTAQAAAEKAVRAIPSVPETPKPAMPAPIRPEPVVPTPIPMPIMSPIELKIEQKPILPSVPEATTIPNPQFALPRLSKSEIIALLDEKLQSTTIDDSWYAQVNDLIFDLAMLDRKLSQEYLQKIRVKTAPVIVPQQPLPKVEESSVKKEASSISPAPSADGDQGEQKAPVAEPMKRGTPPPLPGSGPMKQGTPPPPLASAGGMKKGTPPAPPSAGGIKKGGTPPPPPGPMVKGKKAPVPKDKAAPAAPKGPDPLTIKVSYGAAQLAKRSTEEITELFNQLLDALATYADFWDAIKKAPKLEWRNKIEAVQKALLDPNRGVTLNVEQMIKDRTEQVKLEKAQQGLQKQESAEKEKQKENEQEQTPEELIKIIEELKKKPNIGDFKWLIQFQVNIKKLDKINHEKAAEYEAEFLKNFPDQKPFLPKKKP